MSNENIKSTFRTYSHINNTSGKTIKKMGPYLDLSAEWVAIEKIHGANLSFLTDGVTIMTARRSGIIPQEENFYSSTKITEKYHDDILEVYRRIKTDNPETSSIQIFGEIFGGSYPGYQSISMTVQKGIYYNNEIDFLVFDIVMKTNNYLPFISSSSSNSNDKNIVESWYLSQDEIIKYLNNLSGLQAIPISHKGSFDEIISINPVFETTIPKLYGLPPIEKNMAEGYVFKANKRHPCHQSSRPILKKKNSTFAEVSLPLQSADKLEVNDVSFFYDKIILYITQNRFNNVISKIGINNPIPKIRGLLIMDAIKDFKTDLTTEENNDGLTSDEINTNELNTNELNTNEPIILSKFTKCLKKLKDMLTCYLAQNNLIEIWLNEHTK